MPKCNRSVVSEELQYILPLLQILGLFPRFGKTTPKFAEKFELHGIQFFTIVIGSLLFGNLIFYLYFSFENVHNFTWMEHPLQTNTISQYLESTLCVLTFTFIFYACAFERKNQLYILKKITSIDKKFVEHHQKLAQSTHKYFSAVSIYLLVFCNIQVVSYTQMKAVNRFFAVSMAYYSVILIFCAPIMVFIACLLNMAATRLRILNSSLQLSLDRSTPHGIILTLTLHEKVAELVRRLNDTYGIIFLSCFLYGFYTITCELFDDLQLLIMLNAEFWYIFSGCIWISTFLFLFSLVSVAGGSIRVEVSKGNSFSAL